MLRLAGTLVNLGILFFSGGGGGGGGGDRLIAWVY